MQARDRLIVALDRSERDEILRLVDALSGSVGMFKLGLQAFIANGPGIVREVVARGEKVFLDLKVHDIPNTASHAVAEIATLGASITTVHAGGGPAMLRACVQPELLVLAVTVLTSLDEHELAAIGFDSSPVATAVRFAQLAKSSAARRGCVATRD
jgi:orotidine-5'-phosphate decarboxylase